MVASVFVGSAMSLFRLVYGSRPHPDILPRLDEEVRSIVATSQRNNTAEGVSGMLLSHQGMFVQVLEGERWSVEAVFARVQRDPRHVSVRLVSGGEAPERLFGDWSMCARTLSDADARVLELIGTMQAWTPQALTPVPTLNLLSAIAQMRDLDQAA